jgi:hypothetical protein
MTRLTLRDRDRLAALAQIGVRDAVRAEMHYEQARTLRRGSKSRRHHRRAAERAGRAALTDAGGSS